jgi:hypothetical protein
MRFRRLMRFTGRLSSTGLVCFAGQIGIGRNSSPYGSMLPPSGADGVGRNISGAFVIAESDHKGEPS